MDKFTREDHAKILTQAANQKLKETDKMKKDYLKAISPPDISEFCNQYIKERTLYHSYLAYKDVVKHAAEE